MLSLVTLLLPLVGLGLLLWCTRRWQDDGPAARRLGLALVVAASLISGGLLAHWRAPFHLHGPAFIDDDFTQYCATVASLSGIRPVFADPYVLRPPVPMTLAAALFEWMPLLDAMRWAARLWAVGLVLGAGLWAWVLAGPTAGVLAAMLAPAFASVARSSVDLTGYPALGCFHALAAAGAAAAMRWRSPGTLVLGGAGVGLTLLGDQFGVFWAVPPLLVTLAAALSRRGRLVRLLLVLAPIGLSFAVARSLPPEVAFPPDGSAPRMMTLDLRWGEHQDMVSTGGLAEMPADSVLPGGHVDVEPQDRALARVAEAADDPGWYWGRSGPLQLVATLRSMGTAALHRPPPPATDTVQAEPPLRVARRQVLPALVAIGSGAVGIAWLFLAGRRDLALATVVLAAPFAGWLLVQPTAAAQLDPAALAIPTTHDGLASWLHPKLLAPAAAAAPVALAMALHSASGLPSATGARLRAVAARLVLVGAAAALLVTGLLPSVIGPLSPVQPRVRGDTEALLREQQTVQPRPAAWPPPESPMGGCAWAMSHPRAPEPR